MPDGWVRIYHPDFTDGTPDPDDPADVTKFALATTEAFETVWKPRGFVDLDEVREAGQAAGMPERAADRIKWIDADPNPDVRVARAQAALENEESRGDEARSTVISHAEDVLTSSEDETTPSGLDTEE